MPQPDAGPCGAQLAFEGELVDWDSTDAAFCGVFGATVEAPGAAAKTTPPNGRIELCLADAPTTLVDVTPPTAASECTHPPSTYSVPGVIVADRAVLASGALISARSFTTARAPAFGFDPAKAQVFVHVDGAAGAVSISSPHDPEQAFDGAAWAAGSSGVDVFFPNVDSTDGETEVRLAGGGIGTGPVELTDGAFTYVTVVAR